MANVRARTAMHQLGAPLEDVLRWAAKPEGTENSLVDIDAVRSTRDAEMAEQERAAAQAASSDNPRRATAGRTRQARSSQRVKLEFSLEPQDRKTLQEVQDWIDEQRAKVAWVPEPGWKPEKRRAGQEQGTISYETPAGWVYDVPADEFRQMATGTSMWRVPSPEPSYHEMRRQADKLERLGFQTNECRLCHKPIDPGNGPEMAQIRKLLNGRFVLPYIKHPLAPGQEELRFRRLHLLHSVWEEELVVIQLSLDTLTTEQLTERLYDAVPKVLREAQKRRPTLTEDDVYQALDEVLQVWEDEQKEMASVG